VDTCKRLLLAAGCAMGSGRAQSHHKLVLLASTCLLAAVAYFGALCLLRPTVSVAKPLKDPVA